MAKNFLHFDINKIYFNFMLMNLFDQYLSISSWSTLIKMPKHVQDPLMLHLVLRTAIHKKFNKVRITALK